MDTQLIRTILDTLSERAVDWERELTELDSLAGDGDLGVTVRRGLIDLAAEVAGQPGTDIGTLVETIAVKWEEMAPSTFGVLTARALRDIAVTLHGRVAIDFDDAVGIARTAEQSIVRMGKAAAGDRTLLDVLIPFRAELEHQQIVGASPAVAIQAALAGGRDGLDATRDMLPRAGRARWIGARAMGSLDAGALATYRILETICEHSILQPISLTEPTD